MERALLNSMENHQVWEDGTHPKYEDALFEGMCAALEVLKNIHKSRNEDVDECNYLVKRNLEICR